jgi:hypothetical protein
MAAGGWPQDQSAAVFMVAVSPRQRLTRMADLAQVVSEYRRYDPSHRWVRWEFTTVSGTKDMDGTGSGGVIPTPSMATETHATVMMDIRAR